MKKKKIRYMSSYDRVAGWLLHKEKLHEIPTGMLRTCLILKFCKNPKVVKELRQRLQTEEYNLGIETQRLIRRRWILKQIPVMNKGLNKWAKTEEGKHVLANLNRMWERNWG